MASSHQMNNWGLHKQLGLTYEHYMMAGKAKLLGDEEILEKIIQCNSPGEAKKLGRMVRNFDQDIWEIIPSNSRFAESSTFHSSVQSFT